MSLVWKLLRQHISVPQFIGFFFANLFGMIIVLLAFQFYVTCQFYDFQIVGMGTQRFPNQFISKGEVFVLKSVASGF